MLTKFLRSGLIAFLAMAVTQVGAAQAASAQTYERIVILSPVLSEWAAEIMGKALTQKAIVGVSEFSKYPDYLKSVPTVGSFTQISAEKVAALKPDLVLGSSDSTAPEQIEQLKRLKLKVELMPKENFIDMNGWIKQLGRVLGMEFAAETVAKRWDAEVLRLKQTHQRPRKTLFIEIQHEPLITAGEDSYLTQAFATIGLDNVFRDLPQSYPKISKEAVLKKNPDLIYIIDLSGDGKSFEPAKAEWVKFKKNVKIVSGDDFARCSFSLLKGLSKL